MLETSLHKTKDSIVTSRLSKSAIFFTCQTTSKNMLSSHRFFSAFIPASLHLVQPFFLIFHFMSYQLDIHLCGISFVSKSLSFRKIDLIFGGLLQFAQKPLLGEMQWIPWLFTDDEMKSGPLSLGLRAAISDLSNIFRLSLCNLNVMHAVHDNSPLSCTSVMLQKAKILNAIHLPDNIGKTLCFLVILSHMILSIQLRVHDLQNASLQFGTPRCQKSFAHGRRIPYHSCVIQSLRRSRLLEFLFGRKHVFQLVHQITCVHACNSSFSNSVLFENFSPS